MEAIVVGDGGVGWGELGGERMLAFGAAIGGPSLVKALAIRLEVGSCHCKNVSRSIFAAAPGTAAI